MQVIEITIAARPSGGKLWHIMPAFVSGIGHVGDDVASLARDCCAIISKLLDDQLCEFNLEGQAAFSAAKSSSVLHG